MKISSEIREEKTAEIEWSEKLITFINKSTSAYQTVVSITEELKNHGWVELNEHTIWELTPGDRAFVIRNGSSVIAFEIPKVIDKKRITGFHMVAAHSDSPCFKVKENTEQKSGEYLKLNVEKYGGMIMSSWLDRPLSIAGRIVAEHNHELREIPVDLKKDMFIIPSLAIHMTRQSSANELNAQTDMQPLAGDYRTKGDFYELLAKEAGVSPDAILGTDLFLYNRQPGCILGMNQELVAAPRLDDLACVFAGLQALIARNPHTLDDTNISDTIRVLAIFDNEEVGSLTRQGADSNFLMNTISNLCEGLGLSDGMQRRLMSQSFLISADNAHAVHPNHQEKADVTNQPYLNQGIVIKYHGGQKYTTDAYSGAFVKKICKEHQIPFQTYHNRSDIPGGSTLGNIALGKVSIPAADIGIAQLAMHSAFETMGTKDLVDMIRFMQYFYLS